MLAHSISFLPEQSPEILAQIPARPAVFVLKGHDAQAEPYISKTSDLRKRLTRLLSPPDLQSKRLNLRERVAHIEYSIAGSDFEARLLLYRLLRQLFPEGYRKRVKIAAPALVKIGWENAYPRAYITRRLGRLDKKSVYYGPFVSKTAAEKFLNGVLDLFKSRRCTDDLNPDPAFPGCIYSEMKMCLAPCFKGCTDDEYFAETKRVQHYLDTRGASLVQELARERDQASADLNFEHAAAIHARIEKLKAAVTGLPEIVQRLDRMYAVIVQPAAAPDAVALYEVRAGLIGGPVLFSVQGMMHPNIASGSTSLYAHPHLPVPAPENESSVASKPQKVQTLDSRVAEAIQSIESKNQAPAAERAEELGLVRQWYYRSNRVGEIFFADESGQLPLRRIVRGISRVFRGEKEAAPAAQ